MSTNEIRKWLNLVESKSTLNEYAAGNNNGDGGGGRRHRRFGNLAYYHSTRSFIEWYNKDRKNEPYLSAEDLNSDIQWLQTVADGFLISMEKGLGAYFGIDTMLQDELATWYEQDDLEIRSYIAQKHNYSWRPWNVASKFDEKVFVATFERCIEEEGHRIIGRFTKSHNSDKKLGNWWVEMFVAIMTRAAPSFAQKIKQAMSEKPNAFKSKDAFDSEIGLDLISSVYYPSKLRQGFEEKNFTLADDVNLSVPPGGSMCLWQAYHAATR